VTLWLAENIINRWPIMCPVGRYTYVCNKCPKHVCTADVDVYLFRLCGDVLMTLVLIVFSNTHVLVLCLDHECFFVAAQSCDLQTLWHCIGNACIFIHLFFLEAKSRETMYCTFFKSLHYTNLISCWQLRNSDLDGFKPSLKIWPSRRNKKSRLNAV